MNDFYIICITQPLMQWLFRFEVWTSFTSVQILFEEWGGKVQTPDLLVMDMNQLLKKQKLLGENI